MKEALTSVDVYFLVEELAGKLVNARVDSVYEAGGRTIVFEVFKSGEGKSSFVVAPHFLCVSQYKRDKPKHPSSFVMQLRKKLKGCYIRSIIQHAFDRIVEVELEGKDAKYVLVLEVFSKGNILLLDEERKILGLLEWQKWRDRKLGVKQAYEHPPETVNALSLSGEEAAEILASSERDLVRALAVECGLGGLYAEEVCARAKVEKSLKARELGGAQERVIDSFYSLVGDVSSRKISPKIILEAGAPKDVVALNLKVYEDAESKAFDSFNDAVDEYFSVREVSEKNQAFESKYEKEKSKLEKRLADQEKALEKAGDDAEKLRLVGDQIYARMHEIEGTVKQVMKARRDGLSDDEIVARFKEGAAKGIPEAKLVKDLKKTELVLKL